jgi:hypothetical protein
VTADEVQEVKEKRKEAAKEKTKSDGDLSAPNKGALKPHIIVPLVVSLERPMVYKKIYSMVIYSLSCWSLLSSYGELDLFRELVPEGELYGTACWIVRQTLAKL